MTEQERVPTAILKKAGARWWSKNSAAVLPRPATHVISRPRKGIIEVGYFTQANQWWWIVKLDYDAASGDVTVIRDRRTEDHGGWPPELETT